MVGADERTGLVSSLPNQGGVEELNEFVDSQIRNDFIKKVYSLLFVQLLVTVIVALPFHTVPAVKGFVLMNPFLLWLALALTVVFICVFSCNPEIGRQVPTNYCMLFAFTLVEAFIIGVVTSLHNTSAVLLAAGITAVVVAGLTAYAMRTNADWTGSGPYLFIALLVLCCFGFILIFIPVPILHTIYAVCGALLFSFYLVYDTQLIVGGKHKQHKLNVDEYVFAALSLYLDIINLFLYILSIVSGDRD